MNSALLIGVKSTTLSQHQFIIRYSYLRLLKIDCSKRRFTCQTPYFDRESKNSEFKQVNWIRKLEYKVSNEHGPPRQYLESIVHNVSFYFSLIEMA